MLGQSLHRQRYIPALGSRFHKRSERFSHFAKSLRAIRRWGSNRHAAPGNIFFTARETRVAGRVGSCSRRHIKWMVPAPFSMESPCPVPTKCQCPLWVRSRHMRCKKKQVRFSSDSDRESGFPQTVMSALPPKADMCAATRDVRYGPVADIRLSFDHLIGLGKERWRHDNAQRLGGS